VRQRFFIIIIAVLVALSLVFGGLYLHERNSLSSSGQSRYPLLAQRLFQENPSDVVINFQPLRADIKSYLASVGVKHSFYFQYLFTGTTIRDGDSNLLVGASLMKIPIVMDLYKAVEEGKISLDKNVVVPSDVPGGDDKNFGNQENLKAGDQITLRKASEIALNESDNTAAYTVFEAIDGLLSTQDQALNNLDVELQDSTSADGPPYVMISSRSYASILSCLYFSCFLSLKDSQAVLNNLTNSPDDNGLRGGVPQSVLVAHKIGSFSTITQSDCGIVYVPNRRYLLCIMMDEGTAGASQHIKKLSQMVYDYVNKLNP